MDMLPLKPERKAQLEEYARRRGMDPAAALDDALAAYLEWECQDFGEAVEGTRQGWKAVQSAAVSDSSSSLNETGSSLVTFFGVVTRITLTTMMTVAARIRTPSFSPASAQPRKTAMTGFTYA